MSCPHRSRFAWLPILTLATTLGLAMAGPVATAPARADGPWLGRRVITHYGAQLKVGNQIVDDADRSRNVARGKEQRTHRIYRVAKVNGPWLWLVAETGGARGWVKSEWVIPFDQAIDYFTAQIRANPSSVANYVRRGLAWEDKHEYDIAIADYAEAIRLDPKDATAYNDRGLAWSAKTEYDKALADYAEAIRLDSKDATAYNNRAWLWATCPDAKFRDGSRAVESATRACELSQWKVANHIGTLAAGHAEAGQFDQAVQRQTRAIELHGDQPDRSEWLDRLKLYQDHKPYRDEPAR